MANLGASLHHTKVYEYVNRPTATGSTEQNLSILVRFAVRTGVNWRRGCCTYDEYGALRHAVEIATGGFIRRIDLDHEVDLEYERELQQDVEEFAAGLKAIERS